VTSRDPFSPRSACRPRTSALTPSVRWAGWRCATAPCGGTRRGRLHMAGCRRMRRCRPVMGISKNAITCYCGIWRRRLEPPALLELDADSGVCDAAPSHPVAKGRRDKASLAWSGYRYRTALFSFPFRPQPACRFPPVARRSVASGRRRRQRASSPAPPPSTRLAFANRVQ